MCPVSRGSLGNRSGTISSCELSTSPRFSLRRPGPRFLYAPTEEEVGERNQAADDHYPRDVDRWFPADRAVLHDECTHRSGTHAEAASLSFTTGPFSVHADLAEKEPLAVRHGTESSENEEFAVLNLEIYLTNGVGAIVVRLSNILKRNRSHGPSVSSTSIASCQYAQS
jgi:hypothetical protein